MPYIRVHLGGRVLELAIKGAMPTDIANLNNLIASLLDAPELPALEPFSNALAASTARLRRAGVTWVEIIEL